MVSTLKTTTRSLTAPSSLGSLIGPIAALTMFMPHIPKTPAAPARDPGLSGTETSMRLPGANQVDQRTHYVRRGDDPDKFPALDDGEAADPARSHRVRRLLYRIVGEDTHHVAGHHVLHQDLLQR